jgi:uncharacterized protein YneF (UPF0154 family)
MLLLMKKLLILAVVVVAGVFIARKLAGRDSY